MKIIGNPKYLYIGTKAVLAHLMTKEEYCDYRGWKVPENEDPAEQGYFVEYMDGGKPNHFNHVGYVSWSPKDVFEQSYKSSGSLNFGDAIELLKAGKRVARKGWNGKGMWLILTPGRVIDSVEPNSFYEKCGFEAPITITSHIDMKAADGSMVVGWLASQTDMLAEDWVIVS